MAEVDFEPVSPNHLVNLFLTVSIGSIAGLAFVLLPKILVHLLGDAPAPTPTPLPLAASEESQPEEKVLSGTNASPKVRRIFLEPNNAELPQK